jgi:hypothetical protein
LDDKEDSKDEIKELSERVTSEQAADIEARAAKWKPGDVVKD